MAGRAPRPRPHGARRPFWPDERGASAVEFALLLPVFALLLVGVIDYGGVLYKKFRLNSAVSAGANFALVNATSVSSSGGATLASSIASIMGISNTADTTQGTIVVNNGPTATFSSGSTVASGTAANADSCYCPTLSGSALSWGSAQTCGASCTGGGFAGKFVTIVARQNYTPSFSNYGLVQNGLISSSVVVQTK